MEYHRTYQNEPLEFFGTATVLEHLRSTPNRRKTWYDQILLCRPLPHQDRDSRYHFGEEPCFSYQFISFLAALLIWFEGTILLLINDTIQSFLVYSIRYTCVYYMCRYKNILWWHHLRHLKFTHTSKSVWNISYFRPFCMGLGPEEIVIVLIENSLIFERRFVSRRFLAMDWLIARV